MSNRSYGLPGRYCPHATLSRSSGGLRRIPEELLAPYEDSP